MVGGRVASSAWPPAQGQQQGPSVSLWAGSGACGLEAAGFGLEAGLYLMGQWMAS